MKQSADTARKRSDEMMEQFKRLDSDLQKTNASFDSLHKIDAGSLMKANK